MTVPSLDPGLRDYARGYRPAPSAHHDASHAHTLYATLQWISENNTLATISQ